LTSLEIMPLILAVLVLAISFLLSMFGLGGAQLYVPIFYWLGMSLKSEAILLALTINFITQTSAFLYYRRKKLVECKMGIPLVIAAIPMTFVGAHLTYKVPDHFIALLIGLFLIVLGIQRIYKPSVTPIARTGKQKAILGFLAGGVIGFLIGLLGIGGGSLVVPTLLLLGLSPKHAAATSAFVTSISTLSGSAAHWKMGTVPISIVIATALAAIIGSQLGARFMTKRLPERLMSVLLGILLILIGSIFIVKEVLFLG